MVKKRFPASFYVVAAIIVIPTALYQLVSAAEQADKCALRAMAEKVTGKPTNSENGKVLKCEE